MLEDFDFGAPEILAQIPSTLSLLSRYNGLQVYAAYFPAAMQRLRETFLNVPLETVLHPVSESVEQIADTDKAAAATAPVVSRKELLEAAQPRYLFIVKIPYQDELERPEGTRAEEPFPGALVVYDSDSVVARYNKVERWSRQGRS